MNINTENGLAPESSLAQTPLNALGNDELSKADPASRYGFSIGKIGFLIAQDTFSEIIRNISIYPIPNTKDWMKGLINLRGNLVPVYDLSLLLGYSHTPSSSTSLVVLGKDSLCAGILIERLPKPCNIAEWKTISSIPQQLSGLEAYIDNAYASEEKIWLELNHYDYFKSIKEQIVL